MKIFRILSLMPLLWVLWCLLIFGFVTIYLGRLPFYGKSPDPTSLGIEYITATTIFVLIAVIGSFPVWILVFLRTLKNKSWNKSSFLFAMIYIISMFLMVAFHRSLFFQPYMDWFYD